MRLAETVHTSERVAEERGRLAKIALLAEHLRALGPDEVALGFAYLSGVLPQGRIGVGPAALREMRGVPPASDATLTLWDVDRELSAIASESGAGSATRRFERLGALFARATAPEQRFVARLLFGELGQGAQEGVLADALAKAAEVPAREVRRALMLSGDAGAVARACLVGGSAALAGFQLELFRPVAPMLADTKEDLGEVLAATGPLAAEYKLDGARVQVHKRDAEVRVFSRLLNDVTRAVPEVVEAVLALPARELVLDGEAIALAAGGRPASFQTTMRRFGRRQDVAALRSQLPLASFFFDLLRLDGEDLLERTTEERARALAESLPPGLLVPRAIVTSEPEIQAFLSQALAAGHEGLLLKALDAPYEAGRRGASWLKLKPAHSLDLVVLAAEWGSGRRKGWLSNLHLGARDPKTGGLVMLGKTFKGMSDEMLAWQTEKLLALEAERDARTVYVRPELVVEIAFDGVQASPQYPGGLALRFARVRRYREDKRAAAADTIDAVRAIFVGKGG